MAVAGTGYVYTRAISNVFGGAAEVDSHAIDFLTNTIKVALVSASYTPNQDTHEFFDSGTDDANDPSFNELANLYGYTTGGATITSKTVTEGTNSVIFDGAATTVWTASGGDIGPAAHAIIYKDTGTPTTSPLISYITFASAQTATDGNTFTITWDATNGVFKGTTS